MAVQTLGLIDFMEAEGRAKAAADFILATLDQAVVDDIHLLYDAKERDQSLDTFRTQLKPESFYRMTLESQVLHALSSLYIFVPPKE